MDIHEFNDAQALDNKRKVMKSNIFGDDSPQIIVTHTKPPNQEQPANNYSQPENENLPQPPYQSPRNANNFSTSIPNYSKPFVAPVMQETSERLPNIDPVDPMLPLPSLSTFPEFRFNTIAPKTQINLGVLPNDRQKKKADIKIINVPIDCSLQKMRDEIESITERLSSKVKLLQQTSIPSGGPINPQLLGVPLNDLDQDKPQFSTESHFVFPDGSSLQKMDS